MTVDIKKFEGFIELSFENDEDNGRLKLLVILSPIFIASFDNGSEELGFLKKTINESKFSYGLYPNYFESFDVNAYWESYKNYQVNEDIYLDQDNIIHFRINAIDDEYLSALIALIKALIINDETRLELLEYFAEIRDDIVRNGRRSILANGIQGFYLSKYVVVWMLDLCKYTMDENHDLTNDIKPIYDLANNLKTPRDIKN